MFAVNQSKTDFKVCFGSVNRWGELIKSVAGDPPNVGAAYDQCIVCILDGVCCFSLSRSSSNTGSMSNWSDGPRYKQKLVRLQVIRTSKVSDWERGVG